MKNIKGMKKYDHKNCQSLFGYSAEVHIRCKAKCQLCGCGGEPVDFDMWRQLTVEHIIGKSQGGYLKEVHELLKTRFPKYSESEIKRISKQIDSINTVTACQFCNSATSRYKSEDTMDSLILVTNTDLDTILLNIQKACEEILENKKETVKWKLESVREAFNDKVLSRLS